MVDTDYFETFTALTGITSQETIQRWLEIGNFDVETAIQMFYASQEGHGGGIPNPPPVHRPSTPQRNLYQPHSLTQSLYPDVLASFRQYYTDDEEMHRALQQQSNKGPVLDEDGIRRADDIIRSSRLIGGDDRRAAQERERQRMRATAFTSGNTFQPKTEKEKTLFTLFQPPHDIMMMGDLEAAKNLATKQKRWLLVNLQRDSEFACHVLNRDLWNEESVKDMILCSFIFWQQLDASIDGSKFMERYKVVEFPHVSILDPRTGALVWRRDGDRVTPARLMDELPDFLSRNAEPDDADIGKLSSAARAKELLRLATASSANASSSSSSAAVTGNAKKRPFEDVPSSSSSSFAHKPKQHNEDDDDYVMNMDDKNDDYDDEEDYHYPQEAPNEGIEMELKRQRRKDSSFADQSDRDYEQAIAMSFADAASAAQQSSGTSNKEKVASDTDNDQPGFVASTILNRPIPSQEAEQGQAEGNKPISLRIKADNTIPAFVLKLNSHDFAVQLLREVSQQLQERQLGDRRFELSFGHPVARLQSLKELSEKRLSEVGIDGNMVINLRFL